MPCGRVHGARCVSRLPGVPAGTVERHPPSDRADAARGDPSQVVPLDRHHRAERCGGSSSESADPAQVADALLADRRDQPNRTVRAFRRRAAPNAESAATPTVSSPTLGPPRRPCPRCAASCETSSRKTVSRWAHDHDRLGRAVLHAAPRRCRWRRSDVAPAVRLPPLGDHARRGRSSSPGGAGMRASSTVRASTSGRELRRPLAEVAHGATATPPATRRSMSAGAMPDAASTARVSAPSAGAGAG